MQRPTFLSPALTRQKLCVDLASLKHACPHGVYVAPVPDEPLLWAGVLFVRKGPYATAILRFQIHFPHDYPHTPPIVVFQSDVFHPLVTPLTTYTYSTRDFGADPPRAAQEQRLPPGGLSLRHGFPEWFDGVTDGVTDGATDGAVASDVTSDDGQADASRHRAPFHRTTNGQASRKHRRPPHVVELLQYVRLVFDTDHVLDSVPLEAAANAGAWHARHSYRSEHSSPSPSAVRQGAHERRASAERSTSPRQQPGGARKPGEWNWQGVWEERVRRSVANSLSEPALYGAPTHDVIAFLKMDAAAVSRISPAPDADGDSEGPQCVRTQ